MEDAGPRRLISRQTSPSGEVAIGWGSSETHRHHIKIASNPSSRAVRMVLEIDGETVASRRVGIAYSYLHEAAGGHATSYRARLLDDNDEVVPEAVSVEILDSADYPAWDSRA